MLMSQKKKKKNMPLHLIINLKEMNIIYKKYIKRKAMNTNICNLYVSCKCRNFIRVSFLDLSNFH